MKKRAPKKAMGQNAKSKARINSIRQRAGGRRGGKARGSRGGGVPSCYR